jgi:hypothetical protein
VVEYKTGANVEVMTASKKAPRVVFLLSHDLDSVDELKKRFPLLGESSP